MIRQDLEYFAGDTINLPVTFYEAGVVIDISDWDVWLTIKSDIMVDDEDADLQVEADLTQGALGIALFTATADDTIALLGHYWYDIKYLDEDDNVQTVLNGKIIFKKSVNVTLGITPPV
jgi:hypothetical protein